MEPKIRHHFTVGRGHYQAGDWSAARPHLAEVCESHDGFADVHNMLGVCLQQTGRAEEAAAHFKRAIELNPAYTEAALNLSVCYSELGRYDEARSIYSEAASRQPKQPKQKGELDAFVRGKLANLHFELGQAYASAGLLEPAVKQMRSALELSPTFADVRTKLAVYLRDLGRFDKALEELRTVLGTRPNYVPAYVHLGVTLWRQGRREEAKIPWQRAQSLEPENRIVQAYLRMADTNAAP